MLESLKLPYNPEPRRTPKIQFFNFSRPKPTLKKFFSNSVVSEWNVLSEIVVNSGTAKTFQNRFEIWLNSV
ncbi:hypothetical protein L596_006203 [Steinernema carpocapsae]|uniref:Uncharacterized protein n=1 Tax=Steinernema carpocapsae TaxID=34508 RepID=A0A4U8V1D9_STECR|nr:hypothetical protein L596_006203 [Steinernema carpocapsae]